MPKTPKVVKEAEVAVETAVEKLLKEVLNRLDKVEQATLRPITSQAESLREMPAPTAPAPSVEPQPFPVPPAYRSVIDIVLNKDFGIETEPNAGGWFVKIVVPAKYSSASADQIQAIGGRDIRPKLISSAGAENELKEWADIVYKSFPPEIQAMIVADRSKNA